MAEDLFQGSDAAPKAPLAPQTRVKLHDETAIYASVVELSRFIARVTSDFRRDIKPTYGVILVDGTARMAVLVREANIARDEAKLPVLDEILRQLEYIQFTLKVLRDLGSRWLSNKAYEASIPLTASIGRQAHALKNHF